MFNYRKEDRNDKRRIIIIIIIDPDAISVHFSIHCKLCVMLRVIWRLDIPINERVFSQNLRRNQTCFFAHSFQIKFPEAFS